jgi:ATP-dependent Lon protease
MATAIASVATGKPVSEEVAMTGEVTLSGQVLPIGGVREKVLAAQRAGIPKVLFPRENESDLEELPEETRKEIEFIPVDWIQEVLDVAFDGALPKPAAARPISRARKAAAAK